MSLYIVDIHGELEGDYEIIKKYEEPTTKNDLGVDLISRADAIGCLAGQIELSPSNVASVHEYLKCVDKRLHDLPSVTPQEPKTGHWISRWYAGHDFRFHVCSECNEEFSCDMETGISIDNYRYCPNCGAKMAENEDKE